jgi:DNA-binding winged helix-turn-helix (wHTH) protein
MTGRMPPFSDAALTEKQRKLLWLFLECKGELVSHQAIWDVLYGTESRVYRHPGGLRVHIHSLRRKLRGWSLISVRKQGYKLIPAGAAA